MANKRDHRALSEIEWQRFADLLRVPEDKRLWLARRLARHVESVHKYREIGAKPLHFYAGKIVKPFLVDIEKHARSLQDALARLSDETNHDAQAASDYLEHELRQTVLRATGRLEQGDIVDLYRGHVILLGATATRAVAKVKVDLPERGLQRGIEHRKRQYDPQLAHFIGRIAIDTHEAGGRLTVSKGFETGTTFDLLDALRPYLPNGFLPPPDIRPASTYRRIIAKATSALKEREGSHRRSRPRDL